MRPDHEPDVFSGLRLILWWIVGGILLLVVVGVGRR
jgi:hypothetical protein